MSAPEPGERPGAELSVAEGDELLVRELGDQHIGWLIRVFNWSRLDGALVLSAYTEFVLIKIRRWTVDGVDRAGLLDDDRRGPFIGTEHIVDGDRCVVVQRRIRRPRRPRSREARRVR